MFQHSDVLIQTNSRQQECPQSRPRRATAKLLVNVLVQVGRTNVLLFIAKWTGVQIYEPRIVFVTWNLVNSRALY